MRIIARGFYWRFHREKIKKVLMPAPGPPWASGNQRHFGIAAMGVMGWIEMAVLGGDWARVIPRTIASVWESPKPAKLP